jgi:endonuclease/exonuclease/phosphatase family metal-dependent hydrolase
MISAMRIVTWNILEGGGKRLAAITKILRELDPDLLGLCEAPNAPALAKKLGLACVQAKGSGVALLHRPKLTPVETDTVAAGVFNGVARIAIETPIGRVAAAAAHLHPYSSILRTAEAEIVASKARRADHGLILGDMNAICPGEIVPPGAPEKLEARLAGPEGAVDGRAIATIFARGFEDVAAPPSPTFPTRLDGKLDRYRCQVRLDYIFATRELASRCTRFETIDTPAAHAASDHLPVMAEFDV